MPLPSICIVIVFAWGTIPHLNMWEIFEEGAPANSTGVIIGKPFPHSNSRPRPWQTFSSGCQIFERYERGPVRCFCFTWWILWAWFYFPPPALLPASCSLPPPPCPLPSGPGFTSGSVWNGQFLPLFTGLSTFPLKICIIVLREIMWWRQKV